MKQARDTEDGGGIHRIKLYSYKGLTQALSQSSRTTYLDLLLQQGAPPSPLPHFSTLCQKTLCSNLNLHYKSLPLDQLLKIVNPEILNLFLLSYYPFCKKRAPFSPRITCPSLSHVSFFPAFETPLTLSKENLRSPSHSSFYPGEVRGSCHEPS